MEVQWETASIDTWKAKKVWRCNKKMCTLIIPLENTEIASLEVHWKNGAKIDSKLIVFTLYIANGHITLNTPVLVRSPKLSNVEPS